MNDTRIEKEVEICGTNLDTRAHFLVISLQISLVSGN
jgi:hypothetical protein